MKRIPSPFREVFLIGFVVGGMAAIGGGLAFLNCIRQWIESGSFVARGGDGIALMILGGGLGLATSLFVACLSLTNLRWTLPIVYGASFIIGALIMLAGSGGDDANGGL